MKRSTILIIILTCFAVLCLGQRRARVTTQKIIQLTDPDKVGKVPFEEALSRQQNVLVFNGQTLERTLIGQLAWAAQGQRQSQGSLQTQLLQEEASPIVLYMATHEGFFVYQPSANSLQQTIYMDIRGELAAATAPMGDSVAGAGCTFVIAAPTRRLGSQRSNRSRTSMYLQTGHIAQNIQLQAVCLGLGSTTISEFNTRNVSTACRIPRNLEPLYIICVGYPASQATTDTDGNQVIPKRAALIVPSVNFRDEECFETRNALAAAGVQVVIASTRMGVLKGTLGGLIEANTLINQLRVDDFDGLIFIGGAGAIEYVLNQVALSLIREAVDKRKIIGATSTAPSILGNAGVLPGVKVTALFTESVALQQVGAVYTGNPVEQDMKIITCSGPAAAIPFARAVTDAITGR